MVIILQNETFLKKENRLLRKFLNRFHSYGSQLDSEKKLVGFVVLQLYEVDNVRYQVVKHDCAHGIYHIHAYYECPHSKVKITNEPITAELYWRAKKEILEHWLEYRERYARKHSLQEWV